MKFKTRKDILFIISYVAIIIFALVNFDKIINVLGYVINVLSPFIIGALLAFVLNVLIKFIDLVKLKRVKYGKKLRGHLALLLV